MAQKEQKTRASKAFFIFSVTSLVCNVLMAIFYVLIVGMGIMIAHHDSLQDITLYTQAISEWTSPGWIDFKWSSTGICALGYEPIGNTWLGTIAGKD